VTAPQPLSGSPSEPTWEAIGSEILERLTRTLRAPRDWLEDVTQDALVCMVILANGGERIANFVAFGVAFARKRWIDDLRKRRCRGENLVSDFDEVATKIQDEVDTTDWLAMLRGEGWEPTEAWSRILAAIVSGARGHDKIAAALGLHVSTVQESRKRLRQWLQEKLDPPPPP